MSGIERLGGALRKPLMIDETSWNTGKIFSPSGIVSARCFQRVGTSYTLTVSGFYSGSAPSGVDVSINDAVSGAVVVARATLAASPSAHAFTGTVSVPQGNLDGSYLYKVRVYKTGDPNGTYTESYSIIVVGIGVLMIGQSNTLKLYGGLNRTPLASSAGVFRYGGGQYIGWYQDDAVSQIDEPTATNGNDGFGGDGAAALGNTIAAATRVPVFMLQMAVGATTIITWQTAANGGTHTSWDNLLAQLARAIATGYGFEACYWEQGGTDGVIGTAKATYMTGITNVYNQTYTLSGQAHLPFVLGYVHHDLSATDSHMDAVRQAQLAWYDGVNSGSIVLSDVSAASYLDMTSLVDFDQGATNPHFNTNPQYRILGYRAGCAMLYRMGLTATGMKGPKFTGTLVASAAGQTITLPITQDAGTALLDVNGSSAGTGLTPFRAFNNVTQKTISATAFSGNNIVLTLAGGSFIAGDTINVDYQFGGSISSSPLETNPAYDNVTVPNTGLGRPLQPTRGQISGTAGV